MPRPPTVGGRADEVIRLPESPPERMPPNDHRGRRDSGRRAVPAGRALAVMLTCLFVWLLLDAPALKRAAEASPIGTRRSVSLAFLRPLAASSEFLQLDLVRGAIARAVGRSPEDEAGVASIAPVPVTSP